MQEEKSLNTKYIGRLKEVGEMSDAPAAFILVCMVKPGSIRRAMRRRSSGMILGRNKRKYYQKGLRAMELILFTLYSCLQKENAASFKDRPSLSLILMRYCLKLTTRLKN